MHVFLQCLCVPGTVVDTEKRKIIETYLLVVKDLPV